MEYSCISDGDLVVGLSDAPFTNIQDALNAAKDGDTVWVLPGTYHEHALTMHGKAVRLIAVEGHECTTIDGLDKGTVLCFWDGETPDSLVRGFTVRGGKASGIRGGGAYVRGSSPTFQDMCFAGNQACMGGGMCIADDAKPKLLTCVFKGNRAQIGGGVAILDASPTFRRFMTTRNRAELGGGLFVLGGAPDLRVADISYNFAESGGGLAMLYSTGVFFECCVRFNKAQETATDSQYPQDTAEGVSYPASRGWGGGIFMYASSPRLQECRVVFNIAQNRGGGLTLHASNPSISGSVLAYNRVEGTGGGLMLFESCPNITRTVINNNIAAQGGGVYSLTSAPRLTNVTITANIAGEERRPLKGRHGGGMYITGDRVPYCQEVKIAHNEAYDGGGVYVDDTNFNMKGVALTDNIGENLSVSPPVEGKVFSYVAVPPYPSDAIPYLE